MAVHGYRERLAQEGGDGIGDGLARAEHHQLRGSFKFGAYRLEQSLKTVAVAVAGASGLGQVVKESSLAFCAQLACAKGAGAFFGQGGDARRIDEQCFHQVAEPVPQGPGLPALLAPVE